MALQTECKMELELISASNFLLHLIRLSLKNINEKQLKKFQSALIESLQRRYRDHWFPEKPISGSGYRCIRFSGGRHIDPIIKHASEISGISFAPFLNIFTDLTIWINPQEVSYRFGDGTVCVLYEFKKGQEEPWKPGQQLSTPTYFSSMRTTDYLLDPRESDKELSTYTYITPDKFRRRRLTL